MRPSVVKVLTVRQRKLVKDNMDIARWAANNLAKNYPFISYNLEIDEIESCCFLALCIAAYHFDPTKSKLGYFTHKIAYQKICETIRKSHVVTTPQKSTVRFNYEEFDPSYHDIQRYEHVDEFHHPKLQDALDTLSPRNRQILNQYFLEEKKDSDISKIHGISKERVRQIKMESLAKLRKQLSPYELMVG